MNSKTIEAKEIEKELLGEILLDNSIMDNILQLIKPVCFADNKHSLLFNVMIKMYESGLPIDELTLYENVKKIGYAEQTPIKFIAGIRNEVYSVANYDYHTKIIVEKYLQRELIKRSEKILKEALKDGEDVFELIGKAEDEISNITKEIQGLKEDKNLWEDFPAIIDSIEKRYSGNERDGLLSKTFPTLTR